MGWIGRLEIAISTNLPSEASDLHAPAGALFGRSSDLQAQPTRSSFPVRRGPVQWMSFRSCLPLRGSPRFSLGSLFSADLTFQRTERGTQYTALEQDRQSICCRQFAELSQRRSR
jgi:hypothetical protein